MPVLAPFLLDRPGEFRRRVFAALGAVGTDEFGVAEFADRRGAVLLAAGPQIAAGKTAEHGRTAGLRALALQREEYLFDRVHRSVIRTRLRAKYVERKRKINRDRAAAGMGRDASHPRP